MDEQSEQFNNVLQGGFIKPIEHISLRREPYLTPATLGVRDLSLKGFGKALKQLVRELIEPRRYCVECDKYRKILEVTRYPQYRILMYELECGHNIAEEEEKEYFKALDRM